MARGRCGEPGGRRKSWTLRSASVAEGFPREWTPARITGQPIMGARLPSAVSRFSAARKVPDTTVAISEERTEHRTSAPTRLRLVLGSGTTELALPGDVPLLDLLPAVLARLGNGLADQG